MNPQSNIDFNRIKEAIAFLDNNYKQQPSLDEVAAYVHLSSSHFQRMFTEWAGVSPKQFLQYTTTAYAKFILRESASKSLFSVADDLGLSSPSRLHDHFVKIEAMSPDEYRNGGRKLDITFDFIDTIFGEVLIAATHKGICKLIFIDNQASALKALEEEYSNANLLQYYTSKFHQIQNIFSGDLSNLAPLKLHIKGTDFQLKVWEALLKIPQGQLFTYGSLAKVIGNEKASRAVGTAIGANPIAYLIPCHRIIQSSGAFGGYRWDMTRKKAIIGREAISRNKK